MLGNRLEKNLRKDGSYEGGLRKDLNFKAGQLNTITGKQLEEESDYFIYDIGYVLEFQKESIEKVGIEK